MARNDPARIRNAKLVGAATGLRDAVVLAGATPEGAEAIAASREALPRVWDRIDRLGELA